MNATVAALRSFRGDLERLKALRGWTDADIAREIGCGINTIGRMRRDPGSVNSAYTLTVMELLRREERMLHT